jgi:hypothetical protein
MTFCHFNHGLQSVHSVLLSASGAYGLSEADSVPAFRNPVSFSETSGYVHFLERCLGTSSSNSVFDVVGHRRRYGKRTSDFVQVKPARLFAVT